MIDKSFVEKIEKMAGPKIVEMELLGQTERFSSNPLHRIKIDYFPPPDLLTVRTLSGIVGYIREHLDDADSYVVHIEDYRTVNILGEYEPVFGRRKHYIQAVADVTSFNFGNWYDQENFIINLQSQFVESETREQLLKIAGGIVDATTAKFNDDGTTQSAAIKTGLAKIEDIDLPNPVKLQPYRTFPEIEQIACAFVFRMRKGQAAPDFALFESDGGLWKRDAVHTIRDYLLTQMEDSKLKTNVTIIA